MQRHLQLLLQVSIIATIAVIVIVTIVITIIVTVIVTIVIFLIIMIPLLESGGSGNGRYPHLSPHKGIVKNLRDSLSPLFSRRRSNSTGDNCLIDVVPSPIRGEPGQDPVADYTDNRHNTNNNDSNNNDSNSNANSNNSNNNSSINNSPANVQNTSMNRSMDSSLRALSPKRLTPLRKAGNTPSDTPGNSPINEQEVGPNSINNSVNINRNSDQNSDEKGDDKNSKNNENNDEKDENRWSLTALWNATKESARPISLRLVAAANTVRQMRAAEPLNPVTSLFEPATIISGKGLLVMSNKGKMDIKEIKRSRSNNNKHSDEGNFS